MKFPKLARKRSIAKRLFMGEAYRPYRLWYNHYLVQKMKNFTLIFAACAVLFCVGCSKNISVSGTVKYTDGAPVTMGAVMFSQPDYVGAAPIQPDGSYIVSGDKAASGIPRGEYKVCVTASTPTMNPPAGWEAGVSMIDKKYSDPEMSGLTLKVEGVTKYDIMVEYPQTGRLEQK
ncbi:MAG: hypothetical protein LBJ00_10520 [Planctomycetaceae bacterium]|nr:hypothetical protein [Planctomycetaceae bacterium]